MTEPSLPKSPDGVKVIGVEDVFGLKFEIALKHGAGMRTLI